MAQPKEDNILPSSPGAHEIAPLEEDNSTPASLGAHARRNKRKKELAKLRKAEGKTKEANDDAQLAKTSDADTLDCLQKDLAKVELVKESEKKNGAPEPVYEIKPAPGKGLGMFAIKDIANGTEILREEPVLKGSKNYINKHAMFTLLPEDKKREYMSLSSHCTCDAVKCNETDFQKVSETNSFEVTLDPPLPIPIEYAGPFVYLTASRINHDCAPNTSRGFTSECQIVFRASKDIKAGEEITTDYAGRGFFPTASRRQHLMKRYKFLCYCKACTDNLQISSADVLKAVELKVVTRPGLPVLGQHTAKEEKDFREVDDWYRQLDAKIQIILKNTTPDILLEIYAKGVEAEISFDRVYDEKMQRLFTCMRENDKYRIGLKNTAFLLFQIEGSVALQTKKEFELMDDVLYPQVPALPGRD